MSQGLTSACSGHAKVSRILRKDKGVRNLFRHEKVPDTCPALTCPGRDNLRPGRSDFDLTDSGMRENMHGLSEKEAKLLAGAETQLTSRARQPAATSEGAGTIRKGLAWPSRQRVRPNPPRRSRQICLWKRIHESTTPLPAQWK